MRAAPAVNTGSVNNYAGDGFTRETSYLDWTVRLGAGTDVLAVGLHQFEFSVDLPSYLPPSCGESTPGVSFQVSYHVEAYAENAAKELRLVRSVYVNVELASRHANCDSRGTVLSKSCGIRCYDSGNGMNRGDWTFEKITLDSRVLAPGRAIAVSGEVRNGRHDAAMLLTSVVQTVIKVEGYGVLDLQTRPDPARARRFRGGDLSQSVPPTSLRALATSIALADGPPPLPTMTVPGVVEVSYVLVLEATNPKQGLWSLLTSSVPDLRVPFVVQRDGARRGAQHATGVSIEGSAVGGLVSGG